MFLYVFEQIFTKLIRIRIYSLNVGNGDAILHHFSFTITIRHYPPIVKNSFKNPNSCTRLFGLILFIFTKISNPSKS